MRKTFKDKVNLKIKELSLRPFESFGPPLLQISIIVLFISLMISLSIIKLEILHHSTEGERQPSSLGKLLWKARMNRHNRN